ncbi:hypothetical protein HZS_1028 [Henneguya salminicola]|nr:hypothetical protein HZS_1028 [Henneguya salminicola]
MCIYARICNYYFNSWIHVERDIQVMNKLPGVAYLSYALITSCLGDPMLSELLSSAKLPQDFLMTNKIKAFK